MNVEHLISFPTLHLNLALTGDCVHLYFPQKNLTLYDL